MKKIISYIFFLFAFIVGGFAQNFPERANPPKLVNDYINLLTPAQVQTLEAKLVAHDKATSTEIAIVCVDNLQGLGINDYGTEILRKWGVGEKGKDNGVVLVIFKNKENTSRKIGISTGYDIERFVTDYTSKQIIDNEMVPLFKNEDYYNGLNNGTDAIIKATEGKYIAPPENNTTEGFGISPLFILLMVLLFLYIMSKNRKNPGGGYMSRKGYRGWNGPIFLPSSGGGWFDGGGSGGGFGGGGFGGFGGGSGGGGGASGDW